MAFSVETVRALQERYPQLKLIGNTPLVEIKLFQDELPDVRLFAKVESFNPGGSLKDRPVLFMMAEALYSGRLEGGKSIIDSSSGNAAIAYSMLGAILNVPVELVIPANASDDAAMSMCVTRSARTVPACALSGKRTINGT